MIKKKSTELEDEFSWNILTKLVKDKIKKEKAHKTKYLDKTNTK